jgi:hypothetical protein
MLRTARGQFERLRHLLKGLINHIEAVALALMNGESRCLRKSRNLRNGSEDVGVVGGGEQRRLDRSAGALPSGIQRRLDPRGEAPPLSRTLNLGNFENRSSSVCRRMLRLSKR